MKKITRYKTLLLLASLQIFYLPLATNMLANEAVKKKPEQDIGDQCYLAKKNGYVPYEETAIVIAVAIWNAIYGKENIERKKPYNALLRDGVWHVRGSLPKKILGGVPYARIDKMTCKILHVSHGK